MKLEKFFGMGVERGNRKTLKACPNDPAKVKERKSSLFWEY